MAGIARLWHDRSAGLGGQLQDCRDLFGIRRLQQQRRGAMIEAARLDEMRCNLFLVGDGIGIADNGGKAGDESVVHVLFFTPSVPPRAPAGR
jgi:hypothetical protein